MAKRVLSLLSFCSLAALFACLVACANYRLGTGAKLEFKSIYIAPVESEALLPQARLIVASQVREAFLRDARVTLVSSASSADAVLSIKLKRYGREATVARTDDAGLARKFSLTLQAECSLTLSNGKELFAGRAIKVQREAYVDGGQLQSEYEALPYLAQDLAKNVTHATLDTW